MNRYIIKHSVLDDSFIRVKVDGKTIHGEICFWVCSNGNIIVDAIDTKLDTPYQYNWITPYLLAEKKGDVIIQFTEDNENGEKHYCLLSGLNVKPIDDMITRYRFKFTPQ